MKIIKRIIKNKFIGTILFFVSFGAVLCVNMDYDARVLAQLEAQNAANAAVNGVYQEHNNMVESVKIRIGHDLRTINK